MWNYQAGPIIIKLGECVDEKADIAKIVKKRLESMKTRVKKRKPLEYDIRKNSNVYMMTECDDVLKNDFKWLINFNLKKIPIRDIDEELTGNKFVKRQKSYRRKNSVIKHTHKLSLSDVIEQCLFIKDEATIKEINKWISDAFPCFKSNGCTWKNSVRKTLMNNPIFKKRKLKLGRSCLWCLDENYLRDSSYVKETLYQAAKPSITENDLIEPEFYKDFRELTSAIQEIQENISSEEDPLNTTGPVNITEMQLSATWIESRGHEDLAGVYEIPYIIEKGDLKYYIGKTGRKLGIRKVLPAMPGGRDFQEKHYKEVKSEDLIECYEMPIEFQDKNAESVEVHFLDENNMLIPIDLI